MNSIFGLFKESWILRVSCKVSEAQRASRLLCKRSEVFIIPWTDQKLNVLLILNILNIEIIYNLGTKKQFCIKYIIVSTVLLECKAEQRNNQCEHGQSMEQTRGSFWVSDSCVARCQSQHQCHFWRMNSISKCIARASELSSCKSNYANHEAMNGCKSLKIH